MEKCLNTFKKPSLDEFCDYIEKHGFASTLLTSTKSSTRRGGLTLRVKLLSLGLH